MNIQIILGSTRPGRMGEQVAQWVHDVAVRQYAGQAELELVDLADYDLPHFDEAVSPRFNPHRQPSPVAQRWLAKVAEADGYVVVTPEYNHSIPAILKDALDYLDFQFAKKPVAIVSYGVVGGARAAEQLKLIITEVKAALVPEAVALIGPQNLFDGTGSLRADLPEAQNPTASLEKTLQELGWWAQTLQAGRQSRSA